MELHPNAIIYRFSQQVLSWSEHGSASVWEARTADRAHGNGQSSVSEPVKLFGRT